MRCWALSLIGMLACGPVVLAQQDTRPVLTPAEASGHLGETATVCGHPDGFVCSIVGTAFNFTVSDRLDFRVFIPKSSRRQFGPRLEDRFAQRSVCATGPIEPLGRSSQIVVSSVENLVIESGQSPPATVFGPSAYRAECDPGVENPKLKRSVPPRYTADALSAGIQGTVALRAIVEKDGRVREVIVVRSLERGLDAEAVRAAKQFQFEPGTLDGVQVPVMVSLEIDFAIKGR